MVRSVECAILRYENGLLPLLQAHGMHVELYACRCVHDSNQRGASGWG